jgi:hypothetical protein
MADGNNSGIRNAEVRYKERVEDLSTEAHIRARAERTRSEEPVGDDFSAENEPLSRGRAAQLAQAQLQIQAEQAFADEGIEMDPEEIGQTIKAKPPEKPGFPFAMFSIALLGDCITIICVVSGVGMVVSLFSDLIFEGILFIMMLHRGSDAAFKKKAAKKSAQRLLGVVFAKLIPVLEAVPANTIWVLMAYSDEKKLAEGINAAMEKLKRLKRR